MLPRPTGRRSGFTLMELLVVIIIILLLVGILLPALSAVRGRADKLASQAQLTAISTACETYSLTFEKYPGYFSDKDFLTSGFRRSFTGTENLVLSLLGRVTDTAAASDPFAPSSPPTSFTGKSIDRDQVGAGPRDTSGRVYGAFYSPKAGELALVTGTSATDVADGMFELVDPRTGVPVLYYRNTGAPLPVSNEGFGTGIGGAYHRPANEDYLDGNLTTVDINQTYNQATKSLLADGGGVDANDNLAWLVIHPTLGDGNGNPNEATDVVGGGYVLISAGRDGIYFSIDENDGNTSIADLGSLTFFDDIVVQGGSN